MHEGNVNKLPNKVKCCPLQPVPTELFFIHRHFVRLNIVFISFHVILSTFLQP